MKVCGQRQFHEPHHARRFNEKFIECLKEIEQLRAEEETPRADEGAKLTKQRVCVLTLMTMV